MADWLDKPFAGPYSVRGLARGLRDAVVGPMVDDVRQGNRVLQEEHPVAYQVAQMHPAIGIPTAALNYADGAQGIVDAGESPREKMIKASLSAIPVAERTYQVGNTVARGLRQVLPEANVWRNAVNLGTRASAGENLAEAGEAGWKQGSNYAR